MRLPADATEERENFDLKQKSEASIHMRTTGSYEDNVHFFMSIFMESEIQLA